MALDQINRDIISVLLADGRASLAEISQKVGLSSPAVKRRLDALIDTGVISGFTAVVDPERLGWGVEAYVELHCKGRVAPGDIRAALIKVPEVIEAATISGTADALVHLVAQDVRHLERALENIRVQADIDHTTTSIVLSRLIERPGLTGSEAWKD